MESVGGCSFVSFIQFLVMRMPLIGGIGLLAVAIPSVIRIKYGKRLESISAMPGTKGQQSPFGQQQLGPSEADEPLPFETFGSAFILDLMHLTPLIRGFTSALRRVAEHVSESWVLRIVCVPLGSYYFMLTTYSRDSLEGQVGH